MGIGGVAVVALGVLVFALLSKRLEGSIVTLPMVFVAFGWLIGSGGVDIAHLDPGHDVVHVIAEITLVLVLFSDATRIDLKRLLADHNLPLRMLAIGMPLTILAGAIAAALLFPMMSWAMVFLLAAILAPTDAALGQSVVSNRLIPVRMRQALNVESGLNDGIALPLVLIFAIWAGAPVGEASSVSEIVVFALLQVILGPLVGALVGMVGAFAINRASDRGWMTVPFEGIAILAVAALAFVGAELIGGNGFIAAFAAGLVFGAKIGAKCTFLLEFMETEGQLLTLVTFLILGTAMAPLAFADVSWTVALYAVVSLSLVRLIPVAVSLAGTGLSSGSVVFLGWFGPRGLASILFALLILEKHPIPGGEAVLTCVVVTVVFSVMLHGVSAAPFAAAYGRMVARKGECEECRPASEMPLRHGMSENQMRVSK